MQLDAVRSAVTNAVFYLCFKIPGIKMCCFWYHLKRTLSWIDGLVMHA